MTALHIFEDIALETQTEIRELFPDHVVNVKIQKCIGTVLTVLVYTPTEATKVTWHNAKDYVQLISHLTDGRGELTTDAGVAIELNNCAYQLKEKGVKYRKIKGKTFEEACAKMVKWFDKNKELICI